MQTETTFFYSPFWFNVIDDAYFYYLPVEDTDEEWEIEWE